MGVGHYGEPRLVCHQGCARASQLHVPAGAMDAGMPVGGIRISREAGTTVRTASYLPTDCAVFCRFLSSRKVSASRQASTL